MTDVTVPPATPVPTIGTVVFYDGREGHGIAIAELGRMAFKISFRMDGQVEVALVDDVYVLGDSPKDQMRRITINETVIAMVVAQTDTGKLRANTWGILPKDYLGDVRPVVVPPAYKPKRKRHKKNPRPTEA